MRVLEPPASATQIAKTAETEQQGPQQGRLWDHRDHQDNKELPAECEGIGEIPTASASLDLKD